MKVQKRDGRIVAFEEDKIVAAIQKANVEVDSKQQADKNLIDEAITNVEKTGSEVMAVESIQDIIEKTLVRHNKYALAKNILYTDIKEVF